MKKNFIKLLALSACLLIMVTNCKKVPATYEITGTVTYIDASGTSQAAAGAVISLYANASVAGTTATQLVVADATGNYTLEGIEKETTNFVLAEYNTENTNLKSDGVNGVTFVSTGSVIKIDKEDATLDITVSNFTSTGTDSYDLSVGDWSKESHSKITWSTLYHGNATLLTGGFGSFSLTTFKFDEADPTATVIKAEVDLTSISTFESGRDGLGHCVYEDLGIEHNGDTLADGSLDPAGIDTATTTAYFNSTSVEAYGDGYLATGNLIFRQDASDVPISNEVDLFFTYLGTQEVAGYSSTNDFAIFEGEFTFLVTTDYEMDYSGGDEVTVNIHLQLKGPDKVK